MARKKVVAEPMMKSWAEVDEALRDIRECRHVLAELGVERDRRIDAAKDEYAKNALPLQNRQKKLEGYIKEYTDAHRAELTGKSKTLNFGTVGYRLSSKLMLAPRQGGGRHCHAEEHGQDGAGEDQRNAGPGGAEKAAAGGAVRRGGVYSAAG